MVDKQAIFGQEGLQGGTAQLSPQPAGGVTGLSDNIIPGAPIAFGHQMMTMTFCTIEITQLDTLSNENDRARNSRATAGTLLGLAIICIIEPFFMGIPWSQLDSFVQLLQIVMGPIFVAGAVYFWWDSKKSLDAGNAIKTKVMGKAISADIVQQIGIKQPIPHTSSNPPSTIP